MQKDTSDDDSFDINTARFAIGRGSEGLANARKALDTVRGRPKKGSKSLGSRARSLRLPDVAWTDLEAIAKDRQMPLHRLLRVIVAEYLYTLPSIVQRQAQAQKKKLKPVRKPARKARKTRAA